VSQLDLSPGNKPVLRIHSPHRRRRIYLCVREPDNGRCQPVKAASEFKDKTTAINQLWQTDFTYLKVLSWGWFYLSTILDDYSRYIIAWKLCTNMRAEDVTDTLDLALQAWSGDFGSAASIHQRHSTWH
jgi:transposase InsO family protein